MAESDTVTIVTVDRRFIGPGGVGRAGVVCGLAAAFVVGPVEVCLHRASPPVWPLSVHELTGGGVELREVGAVVASAVPLVDQLEPPPPVAVAPGRGSSDDVIPGAVSAEPFVWDSPRPGGHRPAPHVAGDGLYASPWLPDVRLAGFDGLIPTGLLWAVLDGASGWAAGTLDVPGSPLRLDRLAGVVHGPPEAGMGCLVVARADGRRETALFSRAAIYTEAGRLVAAAAATWSPGVRGR